MSGPRFFILLGCAALIFWLGGNSLDHINELYDGLCPYVQGEGMAYRIYDGDRQGYCTGIGGDLWILQFIMFLAIVAVPGALAAFWHYYDEWKTPSYRGKSNDAGGN